MKTPKKKKEKRKTEVRWFNNQSLNEKNKTFTLEMQFLIEK